MHKISLSFLLPLAVLVIGFAFYLRGYLSAPLPTASPYKSTLISNTPQASNSTKPLFPAQVNLDVPFTSQAPNKNWNLPYNEFCEEASSLMAASYIRGLSIPTANFADARLLEIKAFEERRFGYYQDTTAEETAIILREFYKLPKVRTLYNPTVVDIKTALADGKAVIMPAAGRDLGNPYFQNPGPLYHMLVIKGYTANGKFITNDPGTQHGANYIYNADVLMNAMHDWNNGNIELGKKVIIIVG